MIMMDAVLDFLWNSLTDGFKAIFLAIDEQIYGLISLLYQKFLVLASLRIGNDSMFQTFADSMYTLIVIFALFLLAYSLLKNMINADSKKSGSEIKDIIINTITSVALVLAVPTIFQFLYGAQNAILKYNVIGKIVNPLTKQMDFEDNKILANCVDVKDQRAPLLNIVGAIEGYEDEEEVQLRCYGNMAAVLLFQGFFHPNMESPEFDDIVNNDNLSYSDKVALASEQIESINFPITKTDLLFLGSPLKVLDIFKRLVDAITDEGLVITLADAYNIAIVRGDFSSFSGFHDEKILGTLTYTWGVSTLAGIFAAYVLFLYCLDVAVRAFKLAFYQIIAPIPIMLRITKKKDIFNNWLKAVASCYFEVFTRIIVLYFGMYLISNVFAFMFDSLDSSNIAYNIWTGGRSTFDIGGKIGLWLFVKANIILALFAFMKKAPDIIKEIFPTSNKFSLKLWDHLKDGLAIPATAAGFVGGTLAGGGNPLAGFRAAKKGWNDSSLKGIGTEFKRNLKKSEMASKGGSTLDALKEKARNYIGLDSGVDELNRKIDRGEGLKPGTIIKATNDSIDDMKLLDSEANTIGTVGRGETRVYDKDTKTNVETSLETWKRKESDVKEIANKYDETASGMRTVAASAKAFDDFIEGKVLKGDSKYTIQYSIFQGPDGKYHVVYGLDDADFQNNLNDKLNTLGYTEDEKNSIRSSISKSNGNVNSFINYTTGFLRSHDGENLGDSYDEISQSGTKATDSVKALAELELILGRDINGRMIKAGQGNLNTLVNNIVAGKLLELQSVKDVDGTITSATLDRLKNIQVGSYTLDLVSPGFELRLQDALRNGYFTSDQFVSALKNLETAATVVETEKTSEEGKITQRLNEADAQVKAHTRFIDTGDKAIALEKRGKIYTAQQAVTEYVNDTKGGNS